MRVRKMNRYWIGKGLKIVLFVALAVVGFSFVVMNLWNWLMPPLFGWTVIGFWQALGLLVLSRILLGGWRGRPGYGMHCRPSMGERRQHMTPSESDAFQEGMR